MIRRTVLDGRRQTTWTVCTTRSCPRCPAACTGWTSLGDGDADPLTLVALGEPGEVPPPDVLADLAGDLLRAAPREEDAGVDMATALAALLPVWDVAGRARIRRVDQPPAPAGYLDVWLHRARGFGSGAHPTTRHCLELLLDVEVRGSFADLGCGAGALTIAAAKLGFYPVVGVDLAEEITAPAYENVKANGVDVDIVTGNLLAMDALETTVAVVNVSEIDVHEHVAGIRLPELETVIVSGLRNPDDLRASVAAFTAAGFIEQRRIARDDWPAVLLERGPLGA